MFNFGIERDWLETNPCHMVKRVAPERQRDRVLSENEIRATWKALDAEDAIIGSQRTSSMTRRLASSATSLS